MTKSWLKSLRGSMEAKELRQQEQQEEKKVFSHKLPREFTAKLLYGWGRKRYKKERKKR